TGRALSAPLSRLRPRWRHGPVGAPTRLARTRTLPGGGGGRAALGGCRGHLRAGHPQSVLRPPPGGERDGRGGGPDDGRSLAWQARLRVDGEPRRAGDRPARAFHDQAGSGRRVTTKPLVELAKTIRSKNAGVDQITFDVIFPDRESYELVKRSGAL